MNHYHGDVLYEVWISPAEALVGTARTFAFHTAQGRSRLVVVRVPAGARAGDYVIVPGAGGPSQSGTHYGDFYTAIRIGVEHTNPCGGQHTPALALAAAAGRQWPIREVSGRSLRDWLGWFSRA